MYILKKQLIYTHVYRLFIYRFIGNQSKISEDIKCNILLNNQEFELIQQINPSNYMVFIWVFEQTQVSKFRLAKWNSKWKK